MVPQDLELLLCQLEHEVVGETREIPFDQNALEKLPRHRVAHFGERPVDALFGRLLKARRTIRVAIHARICVHRSLGHLAFATNVCRRLSFFTTADSDSPAAFKSRIKAAVGGELDVLYDTSDAEPGLEPIAHVVFDRGIDWLLEKADWLGPYGSKVRAF